MKVIALFGIKDTGKTTTLNLLNNLINPDNPITDGKDHRRTFTYKGKTISITTPGDNETEIKKNIQYAQDENCDILVTASRTKGYGRKLLREQFKDIHFIKKNVADQQKQDFVNKTQAADLQAIIDDVINQLNAKEASASPTP
jgi:hypothetical protein